jgi:hypothetical protein
MADGLKVNEELCFSSGGPKISQAMDSALGDDDMYDQRILGGGDFVEQVLANTDLSADIHLALETIIEYVAQYYHLSVDQLQWRCKQTNIVHAKALICYIATRRHCIAGKSVAEALRYSPAAVSSASKRGEILFKKDKEFGSFATDMNM